MCSDTELVFMHICSFLMSYNSSNMSLSDIETIAVYNLSRGICCDLPLGKFDF